MTIPPVPDAPRDEQPRATGAADTTPPDVPVEATPAAPAADPYAQQQPYGQQAGYGQQQSYGQQQPYGQQTAAYGQQPAYNYGAAPEPKTLSIVSMVLGIAGLTVLPFLASIAAVITGHMARKREPAGNGFSLAGIITGYAGIALGILGIIVLIAYFAFIATIIGTSSTYSSY